VTAEFAVVMPAVVLVLIIALGALQLAGKQVQLQAAAASVARLAARGDKQSSAILDALPGSTASQTRTGDLICVRASMPAAIGVLAGITVSAISCALSDGQ
jgi:Flp pilus assembly protein TadG